MPIFELDQKNLVPYKRQSRPYPSRSGASASRHSPCCGSSHPSTTGGLLWASQTENALHVAPQVLAEPWPPLCGVGPIAGQGKLRHVEAPAVTERLWGVERGVEMAKLLDGAGDLRPAR